MTRSCFDESWLLDEFATDIPRAVIIKNQRLPNINISNFSSLRASNQMVGGLTHLRENLASAGQRQ